MSSELLFKMIRGKINLSEVFKELNNEENERKNKLKTDKKLKFIYNDYINKFIFVLKETQNNIIYDPNLILDYNERNEILKSIIYFLMPDKYNFFFNEEYIPNNNYALFKNDVEATIKPVLENLNKKYINDEINFLKISNMGFGSGVDIITGNKYYTDKEFKTFLEFEGKEQEEKIKKLNLNLQDKENQILKLDNEIKQNLFFGDELLKKNKELFILKNDYETQKFYFSELDRIYNEKLKENSEKENEILKLNEDKEKIISDLQQQEKIISDLELEMKEKNFIGDELEKKNLELENLKKDLKIKEKKFKSVNKYLEQNIKLKELNRYNKNDYKNNILDLEKQNKKLNKQLLKIETVNEKNILNINEKFNKKLNKNKDNLNNLKKHNKEIIKYNNKYIKLLTKNKIKFPLLEKKEIEELEEIEEIKE